MKVSVGSCFRGYHLILEARTRRDQPMTRISHGQLWPDLPYERWKETCRTLHLWTQVVGKVRLAQSPWLNHSWHVPLYVTAQVSGGGSPWRDHDFQTTFEARYRPC